MHVSLNSLNFSYYVLNPLSEELSSFDRKIALLGSILLGFTLGLGHLICKITYEINKTEINEERLNAQGPLNNLIQAVVNNSPLVMDDPQESLDDIIDSSPLNTIYVDNSFRERLKADNKLINNFKDYLDSVPINIQGYSARELSSFQLVKDSIIEFTVNHINNPEDTSFDNIHTLTIQIAKNLLPIDDELTKFFDQLAKDQLIGGWGSSRINFFIILPPIHMIQSNVINDLGAGSYHHFSNNEIIRTDQSGK